MARIYEVHMMVQEKRDMAGNLLEPAELVLDRPEYLTAKDDTQAAIEAGKLVPAEVRDDPEKYDRLLLVVRPF